MPNWTKKTVTCQDKCFTAIAIQLLLFHNILTLLSIIIIAA